MARRNETVVTISQKDRDELEKLHYLVDGRAYLLARLSQESGESASTNRSIEKYMKDYDELYPQYLKKKQEMEDKYRPEGDYNYWEVKFSDCRMIFWS